MTSLAGSRPARGAWIEIYNILNAIAELWSRPARGAWIEIKSDKPREIAEQVAPRKGRVD